MVEGISEELLYAIIDGDAPGFESAEQRKELIEDLRAGSMGEHSQLHEPLDELSDKALAQATISTWSDYARCECGA